MERIATRKVHFAPLARQERAIRAILRRGRFRNVTQLMRHVIDQYLSRAGHPSLERQVQMMADDFRAAGGVRDDDASWIQESSRDSKETWRRRLRPRDVARSGG